MKHAPVLIAFVSLPLLSQPALSAEEPLPDFSSINNNLDTLEALILDTLSNNEELSKQLQDLRTNLNEKEVLLDRQENLFVTLRQLTLRGWRWK